MSCFHAFSRVFDGLHKKIMLIHNAIGPSSPPCCTNSREQLSRALGVYIGRIANTWEATKKPLVYSTLTKQARLRNDGPTSRSVDMPLET